MDAWAPLVRALDDLPPESVAPPEGGRLGGVLVLLADPEGRGDLEVVYTRRRHDLSSHPGQISFPGGRVDPGETVEQAAVREAVEEVGLDPGTVEILGRLPAFYIPPSRFWLQPVVARWRAPHELVAAEAEVAEVLRVRLSTLRDAAVWRVVRLASAGRSWAWQLDDTHLLWGATAIVTTVLLGMIDPGWHGGAELATFPAEREVRPWETPARRSPAGGPALLWGIEERSVTAVGIRGGIGPPPGRSEVEDAGQAVAGAVARLGEHTKWARTVVLAGGGGNGTVGLVAARELRAAGRGVRVVLDRSPGQLGPLAAAALASVGDATSAFDGTLPPAEVVVDALVGGGLSGELTGTPRDIVLALRHQEPAVVSVDVPSGLHPLDGLVGECVPADVTVAVGGLRPALVLPGLGPFVGDLYLAGPGASLVRLVPDLAEGRRRA